MGRGENTEAAVGALAPDRAQRVRVLTPRARRRPLGEAPVELFTRESAPWELQLRRPALLVVGGVPGSGKSHLIERLGLRERAISADQIREELCDSAAAGSLAETVSPRDAERIHGELGRRVEAALRENSLAIVDAPAVDYQRALRPHVCARRAGAQTHTLFCQASREELFSGQLERGRRLDPASNELYWEKWEALREELSRGSDAGWPSDWIGLFADRAASERLRGISFI